jgi:phospholipase C
MSTGDRRRFLKLMAGGAVASAFPLSIERALAIPAHRRTGTIDDVEHIVILMQENRSFDHYFGTLRGVRGFGDPRAVELPSGAPVWRQPDGAGHVLPFRPDADGLGLQFLEDLPHGWADTHAAWNDGRYDRWVPSKGTSTMAYLTREDIPFHFALADAFTVCDAYHCSLMGATDPNRYHMWTGWVGNDGKAGGPVVDNAEAGYDWTTYPERLEKAGVSWKIYQDAGAGLDAAHSWGWGEDPYIGNYGDNSLLYFHQYQSAPPGSPLHERAATGTRVADGGTLFDVLLRDVAAGELPQVSWVVAPEAYSEHPNWPANYGAWYIAQVLDALTSSPEVWSKTVFLLMYDENDGFFDHVVPPTPPRSRAEGLSSVDVTSEIFSGDASRASGPYGLGMRVPMIVISPWSKGGWVASEVFDHTSILRFIERRFGRAHPGLIETNITPWRWAVVGDLTSAFDFSSHHAGAVALPSTLGYAPPDRDKHPDYAPVPPTSQAMPRQERGLRRARAVPYELHVTATTDRESGKVALHFDNPGSAAAVLHVRDGSGQDGPRTYTVAARHALEDTWHFAASGNARYDLDVHGPNGYFRAFEGTLGAAAAHLAVGSFYHRDQSITLEVENRGATAAHVRITDAYARRTVQQEVEPGRTMTWHWPAELSFGWYDLTVEATSYPSFRRRLAGHVETGRDSVSDPALGR